MQCITLWMKNAVTWPKSWEWWIPYKMVCSMQCTLKQDVIKSSIISLLLSLKFWKVDPRYSFSSVLLSILNVSLFLSGFFFGLIIAICLGYRCKVTLFLLFFMKLLILFFCRLNIVTSTKFSGRTVWISSLISWWKFNVLISELSENLKRCFVVHCSISFPSSSLNWLFFTLILVPQTAKELDQRRSMH